MEQIDVDQVLVDTAAFFGQVECAIANSKLSEGPLERWRGHGARTIASFLYRDEGTYQLRKQIVQNVCDVLKAHCQITLASTRYDTTSTPVNNLVNEKKLQAKLFESLAQFLALSPERATAPSTARPKGP